MVVRVHNPEADGQNSCAPLTPSCAHPNLELGPLALCCFCLHFSSTLLAAISATLAAALKRMRAPAERESTGRWDCIQPLPHPTFSCCSRSLKAILSCRSAISFSTRLSGRAVLPLQRARCHLGPVKVGPRRSGTGQTAARTQS